MACYDSGVLSQPEGLGHLNLLFKGSRLSFRLLRKSPTSCAYVKFSGRRVLYKEDLKGTRIENGFKRAFMSLFGQDDATFTSTMLLNVDQLQKQLDKDEFQEDGSMAAFWSVAEIIRHQRQYDRRVNKRQMQMQKSKVDLRKELDVGLVVTKSSGSTSGNQDTSSKLGNDADADNADIKPVYDEELMAESTKNVDLKAQLQEMFFAIASLKYELRKLKENSVDTKFKKPSVLGKPVLQSLENQSIVRQPTAFKSERPKISKQRFASQVDVKNDFSKPVTQHYLPKGRKPAFVKPHHVIASSASRNNSKNMPRFSSNDMVHIHYLEEAKKKTQEKKYEFKIYCDALY
ncbi:hypothetical protein Tco_0571616 [Tanacetum coccineum]